jgi:hypothetical protein
MRTLSTTLATKLGSGLVAALLPTALVTASVAPAQAQVPAQARPTARATTSCDPSEYQTRVRNVAGTQSIGLTRVKARTYPGRTTLSETHQERVETDRVLKVTLSSVTEATVGASAMLKKVINIYGSVSGRTSFKTSFTSTSNESVFVSTSSTVTIPGGTTVAWFRGWRKVGGTFEYSWCHHFSGMPESVGVVEWSPGRFHSYGYTSMGGQRCDQKAWEPVARAAKHAVCG